MSTSNIDIGMIGWWEPPISASGEKSPMSAALDTRLRTATNIAVLHAPAGFGKTFAMADEARRLQDAGVETGWISGELLAVAGLTCEAMICAVRDVAKGAQVLFLDDPDHLDPAVVAAAIATTLHASPMKRLIIGVRQIKDLHLSRRIAQGVVEVIGGEALAWDRRRTTALWQRSLSPVQMRVIQDLTQGWPAPSQMLARWVSADGPHRDILDLKASHVADFIDHEILSTFDESWDGIFEATSLHEEFDQNLLDRLSREIPLYCGDLAAKLSPLIGTGSSPNMWRYNPLLRRHLRDRFDRLPRAKREDQLRKASDWAADRGDIVSAVHLASIAGDTKRIVDFTIGAGGVGLWLNKGYDKVQALVKVAGDALVHSEPRFQLLRCIVLMKDGRIREAETLFREVVATMPLEDATERDALIVEASLLIYGCRAATDADNQLFYRLSALSGDEAGRHLLPTLRAIRHSQQAEFAAAIAAIMEGLRYARAGGSRFAIMFLDLHAAGVALAQGALSQAAKLIARARRSWQTEFADDHGAETVLSALAAQLEFERGRTAQTTRHLQLSAYRLPHSEAWLDIYVAAFEPAMRLLANEHGVVAALAAIEHRRQELKTQGLDRIADLLTGIGACITGEAWLFGEIAVEVASLSPGPLPPVDRLATWQEREIGTLARAYRAMMKNEGEVARRILDDLIGYAHERGLRRTLQRAFLLQVAVLERAGHPRAADGVFDDAIAIGRATGLKRAFSDFGGPSVSSRLSAMSAHPSPIPKDAFLKGLTSARLRGPAIQERKLTKREQEVLHELAAGGSDKAIARRLGVTEHAIRFHLKNLYSKLAVHDRTGAVAKHKLLNAEREKTY